MFQGAEGCKYRDHKVKVKNPKDSEMYLTLMTRRYFLQGDLYSRASVKLLWSYFIAEQSIPCIT